MENVNIEKLVEKMMKEYDFLYENDDNVAGYHEALKMGDNFIKENRDLMVKLFEYRQDFISSDREVVALMFAMETLGYL